MSTLPREPLRATENYLRLMAYGYVIVGVLRLLWSEIAIGLVFISVAAVLFVFITLAKRYR